MPTAATIWLFRINAILLGFITTVCANCLFRLPVDTILRPKVFQVIGTHKIELPVSENIAVVEVFKGQFIDLSCNTEFEEPNSLRKRNSIQMECNNYNELKCRHDNSCHYNYNYNDDLFQCSPLKWNLYESNRNFVWCPNNVTSYILARPVGGNSLSDYEYLAGICYDTYTNSLKSLYYRMTPKYDENFQPTPFKEQFYRPTSEIEHYRNIFRKRSVNVENYDNDAFRNWIEFSQYNLSSIIQIPRIKDQFYAGSSLDLIWWPSLRLGNWKRYEKALEKHISNSNKSYEILAGVSDVVKAPIIESCATNFTLKVLNDNVNRQIPFYVWNYLRAADNSSEIVIIGVNSPFYEFYAEEDVIFCKDKCHEISWLKAKSSTFRFSPLGIMFCCSVDEVKSLKHLDGFPSIDMYSLPNLQHHHLDTTIKPENEDDMLYD